MSTPADPAIAKRELRSRLLAGRRALSPEQLMEARAGIRSQVLRRLDQAEQAGTPWRRVFAYEAIGSEPASPALLGAMADRGASIYVPVHRPDDDLDWIRWPGSTPLGRQAVSTASVILVPALAIDITGMRIGRGGGSYDRVIPRVSAGVPVVAVLHRGEIFERIPAESWDCRVTAAVSPDGWCDLERK
ncbi:MAG: 5-formyltetrahydrofolate cyclo-ligase [Pseudonocardiales bacterium]|nr:5-formyltetrahydrofolate cyclo-ligase [Pseudonocardiales bacterium]